MGYTIAEIAQKTGLTAYTLRYYDKEGLIPMIERDKNGNRVFNEIDIEAITIICCLKETGMPIREIKKFMKWQVEGNDTLHARNKMLKKHREFVLESMKKLEQNLTVIDEKLEYFKRACKAYDNNEPVPTCCSHKI